MSGQVADTKQKTKLFNRYQKYSDDFERESQRLTDWMIHFPIGQAPPSFNRASTEHSLFKKRKITPLWKQIRTLIMKDGKTLWQHCAWATDDEPPLFSDIKHFLEVGV